MFILPNLPTAMISEQPSSSTIPSSAVASDAEADVAQPKDSPPSSPVSPAEHPLGKSILTSSRNRDDLGTSRVQAATALVDEDSPEVADIMVQGAPLDKWKGVVREATTVTASPPKRKRFDFKQRPVRVSLPKASSKTDSIDLDSDSDLEVSSKLTGDGSKSKISKLDAFSRVPADKRREGNSLLTLRALAHVNLPNERARNGKPSVNVTDMQISLQKRARLQALEERKAKIDDLKARGIFIQSKEDIEKDQAEVEDLLEKARRENEELQQKERRLLRRQRSRVVRLIFWTQAMMIATMQTRKIIRQ